MKLINYFYLMDHEFVFQTFRSVFDPKIKDEAISKLVELCLSSMPQNVVISEWFLFEEHRPMKKKNKILPAKTFYVMSSGDMIKYFIRQGKNGPRRPVSSIGFAAISYPECIRLTVKT